MADRKDRVRIHIEGKEFSVVGGSFSEMLAAVKQINGRRFVGELKVWQLPGTVDEVRRQFDIGNFELEGGQAVSAETQEVQSGGDRIRIRVGEHRLAVVGGSFQEMLTAVKNLPGRRFDGETKTWEITGDVGVVKGMLEAAGFQLEGAQDIRIDPAAPMEALPFGQDTPPPAYEVPDFGGDDDAPPFEPPDWWDDGPPPDLDYMSFDEPIPTDLEPSPFEPEPSGPTFSSSPPSGSGDRIRLRLGETPLMVSGGSFQEMLAVVKNIPGRRFNSEDKVWEVPDDITLDSVQQTVQAAGFVLLPG
jgi:hypothetical protein